MSTVPIPRGVATVGGAGRGRPPLTISAPAQKKKKKIPPGTIIAQYTYVIYIENDLVRLWIPAGALPVDPQSLALRFVGFTHSACHYYSQLFSTTQIGLATTLPIPSIWMQFELFRLDTSTPPPPLD